MRLLPSQIFYSQDSIASKFNERCCHSNKTIGETLDDICENRCMLRAIPPISVSDQGGKWVTVDNRRLWIFRQLEILRKCSEIEVHKTNRIPRSKQTSTNGGKTVKVRGGGPGGKWYLQAENITHGRQHFMPTQVTTQMSPRPYQQDYESRSFRGPSLEAWDSSPKQSMSIREQMAEKQKTRLEGLAQIRDAAGYLETHMQDNNHYKQNKENDITTEVDQGIRLESIASGQNSFQLAMAKQVAGDLRPHSTHRSSPQIAPTKSAGYQILTSDTQGTSLKAVYRRNYSELRKEIAIKQNDTECKNSSRARYADNITYAQDKTKTNHETEAWDHLTKQSNLKTEQRGARKVTYEERLMDLSQLKDEAGYSGTQSKENKQSKQNKENDIAAGYDQEIRLKGTESSETLFQLTVTKQSAGDLRPHSVSKPSPQTAPTITTGFKKLTSDAAGASLKAVYHGNYSISESKKGTASKQMDKECLNYSRARDPDNVTPAQDRIKTNHKPQYSRGTPLEAWEHSTKQPRLKTEQCGAQNVTHETYLKRLAQIRDKDLFLKTHLQYKQNQENTIATEYDQGIQFESAVAGQQSYQLTMAKQSAGDLRPHSVSKPSPQTAPTITTGYKRLTSDTAGASLKAVYHGNYSISESKKGTASKQMDKECLNYSRARGPDNVTPAQDRIKTNHKPQYSRGPPLEAWEHSTKQPRLKPEQCGAHKVTHETRVNQNEEREIAKEYDQGYVDIVRTDPKSFQIKMAKQLTNDINTHSSMLIDAPLLTVAETQPIKHSLNIDTAGACRNKDFYSETTATIKEKDMQYKKNLPSTE